MGKIIICSDCHKEREHHAKGLCKVCYLRYWRENNPEKARITASRYRERNRNRINAYQREWYRKHQESCLASIYRWQERNPERVKIIQCDWEKKNPEKRARLNALRQARKLNLPHTLTETERKQILVVGQSVYPDETLHLDHVVPLSKGGGTTLANAHYIPVVLNLFKKDKLPQEVYKQLELCLSYT